MERIVKNPSKTAELKNSNSTYLTVGPSPNARVILHLQPMLRIAAWCKEGGVYSSCGELVGLEVTPGNLEISDCYMTRNRKDLVGFREKGDAREVEERVRKEVERHKTKIRELLHYVDADCQSLGWWQTMPCTGISDPAAVEELYVRTAQVDQNSMILCFDLDREAIGWFPFRAYRITPEYFKLRRAVELGEITNEQLTKELGLLPLISELPISTSESVVNNAVLMQLHPSVQSMVKSDFVACQALADQKCRDLVSVRVALDDLNAESEKIMRFHKDTSRYYQNLRRAMERKKAMAAEDDETGDDYHGSKGTMQDRKFDSPNPLKACALNRHFLV